MSEIPKVPTLVADAYAAIPTPIRKSMLLVRERIFTVAQSNAGIGPLTETLKWGEPSYLPRKARIGTTVRLGYSSKRPEQWGVFVSCQTTLIDAYRGLFADELRFEGNRGIILRAADKPPLDTLDVCIEMALTYHVSKRKAG